MLQACILSLKLQCFPGKTHIEMSVFLFFKDINECTSTSTNSCDRSKETCENTDGGYICNCFEGYRKLKDQCNGIAPEILFPQSV